ncbi:MAG: SDR family NAD(P)-dependent oxidoreductase [Gammaproteobacteria bacterium]|nr:SDR family NAD(P)-dependent oxidoreductase [Gammaproteobacteria bacterium]MDE0270641.1 SDR family NAD(P)-dependent oxidoreductase [Gammaproteobacteria bacterium]
MKGFAGKVAVVTGGASGIGAAICRQLARESMRVVVADIEYDKAKEVARAIQDLGGEAGAAPVDVTSGASCRRLARTSSELYGDANLLFANAGVLMLGTLATRTEQDWQWVFDVNVFGTVRTVDAFMPQLLSNPGDAHIVITNSMAGLMASAPGKGVYNASKHAQLSYAETLRDELAGEDIAVTLLMPGGTVSAILESERNRPKERGEGAPLSERDYEMMQAHLGETGELVSPEHCIRNLLDGIRNNETWVMAGSPQRLAIERRFHRVIEAFDFAGRH